MTKRPNRYRSRQVCYFFVFFFYFVFVGFVVSAGGSAKRFSKVICEQRADTK
jgi:hypothetical protein